MLPTLTKRHCKLCESEGPLLLDVDVCLGCRQSIVTSHRGLPKADYHNLGLYPIRRAGVKMEILKRCCEIHNLPIEDVLGPGQRRAYAECRRLVAHAIMQITHCTLEECAEFLNRDHSSIHSLLKRGGDEQAVRRIYGELDA